MVTSGNSPEVSSPESCCHSELMELYPTTTLTSLVNHCCYYAFEDLLLVHSTCLMASYGMAHKHRDSKSLSTTFLQLCFPFIFSLANVKKICVVVPTSSCRETLVCIQISRPKFQALPTYFPIVIIKYICSLPRPNIAHLWSRSVSYIFNSLHSLPFFCPLFVNSFPLHILAGTYILGFAQMMVMPT